MSGIASTPEQPHPHDRAGGSPRRAAVIGAGVSGLTAAYLLHRSYAVTLYEAQPRLGGHAHTHDITDSAGTLHHVDTGFIVHNDRTYPHLLRLFNELDIATRPTEMSMSIACGGCGLEYAGGRGAGGILARPTTLVRDRRFMRMLTQVLRFHRAAQAELAAGRAEGAGQGVRVAVGEPFGVWLERHRFTRYFVHHYAIPLVACVWSTGHALALDYPARYLFTFLEHHGMLSVGGSPQWRTVVGGSRTYVDAIAARLPAARLSEPVRGVRQGDDGVHVRTANGITTYDVAVIATHADEALALLEHPTDVQNDVLGAFSYSLNDTVLHTDDTWLPRAPRAQASWNYRMRSCTDLDEAPVVTYWMNRLMGHRSAEPHLVTLNGGVALDERRVLARMAYTHPVYTPVSVAAQARLGEVGNERLVFAGAYHGWGFHEDGAASGVAAAARLGVSW
ncbi:hypothetical protein KEM60_00715 [Austwickia sp. TVS 96-490-7B]|uniref:NAD(P)/FAD-dependent oxidoreductase n=1 Tax=Austwickia sp. TVS 96-490-7B TaxID=2830843 RepID=UPI001C56A9BE|nr:FAD-dependent oxidoreductase [Austwickia sp. TVS 96-490-7B]MBW3084527.1 hypothetical protein [Austwickia sp. TVS 96-490-7B]